MKLADWNEVIDLSPHRKEIESLASSREKQKKGYKTSKQWSNEATNLTGLKGEYAFSLCTGLPVDTELRAMGDHGVDFVYGCIRYDIKSTKFSGYDAALLEFPKKNMAAQVLVLVQINGWNARIIGWASKKQMRHSLLRDFGHGKMLSMKRSELEELGQDTIPPCVPSVSTDERLALMRAELQIRNTERILLLPEDKRGKKEGDGTCFPHGPFDRRPSPEGGVAIYCRKCGRFYGNARETLVER